MSREEGNGIIHPVHGHTENRLHGAGLNWIAYIGKKAQLLHFTSVRRSRLMETYPWLQGKVSDPSWIWGLSDYLVRFVSVKLHSLTPKTWEQTPTLKIRGKKNKWIIAIFKGFWYFGSHLGFCHRNLSDPWFILKIINIIKCKNTTAFW